MTTSNRKRRELLLGLAAALCVPAHGQSDTPVRLILPNATGSGVDAFTRAVQPALAKALGRPLVIENQPGAGGILGLQQLARATPDGSTLGIVSNNVVVFPNLYKSLPFDMPGDFTPIAIVGYTPMVLVVNAKVPARNAKELAALVKSRGGDMTFASGGNGTILHLATEVFLDEAGVKARHIPYKGVGQMITDLIGGQVDFATAALSSVQGHLKSGALRAMGVTTAQRVAAAPDIPTLVEQGLPNGVVDAWFAVLGPKVLPAAEVNRVHAALVESFADAAVKDAMGKQGNIINVSAADQSMPFFRTELAKYTRLAKKIGLEAQ